MKLIVSIYALQFLVMLPTMQTFSQEDTAKQQGGLFGKFKKALSTADINAWRPGTAITTSIKDSLPVLRWLSDDDLKPELAEPLTSFNLKPGYYRGTIRSYCMHAGAYSPTKGNGYQIAQLKGARADLISAILSRSPEHAQIEQSDVQRLIWGIEAGAKFSSYPVNYQIRIKPLLTEKDIALMEANVNGLVKTIIPGKAKDLVNMYSSLRTALYSEQSTYEDIERIAVQTGIPPFGPGDKEIGVGMWSSIGNGFYLRAYPRGYTTVDIELYRPGTFKVERDQQQRIRSFSRDGQTISIEYNDSTGADIYSSKGHPDVPVWRFRTVTFTGRDSGQKYTIRNNGMILRGSTQVMDGVFSNILHSSTSRSARDAHGPNISIAQDNELWIEPQDEEPGTFTRLFERYKSFKEWFERVEWAKRVAEANDVKPPEEYFDMAKVNKMISDGIRAAGEVTNFPKKMGWIADLLKMNRDLSIYVLCQLSGSCDADNNPKRPDLPNHPAQPGNSHMQRLGLSPYVK